MLVEKFKFQGFFQTWKTWSFAQFVKISDFNCVENLFLQYYLEVLDGYDQQYDLNLIYYQNIGLSNWHLVKILPFSYYKIPS